MKIVHIFIFLDINLKLPMAMKRAIYGKHLAPLLNLTPWSQCFAKASILSSHCAVCSAYFKDHISQFGWNDVHWWPRVFTNYKFPLQSEFLNTSQTMVLQHFFTGWILNCNQQCSDFQFRQSWNLGIFMKYLLKCWLTSHSDFNDCCSLKCWPKRALLLTFGKHKW